MDPLIEDAQATPLSSHGPRRRPLVGIAIVFVVGIACGLSWPKASIAALCIGGAALIVNVFVAWSRTGATAGAWTRSTMLCACMFMLAWASAGMRQARSLQDTPSWLPAIDVRGIIDTDPEKVVSRRADLESWFLRLRVVDIRGAEGSWQPVDHVVNVYWNSRVGSRRPVYGDEWEI